MAKEEKKQTAEARKRVLEGIRESAKNVRTYTFMSDKVFESFKSNRKDMLTKETSKISELLKQI